MITQSALRRRLRTRADVSSMTLGAGYGQQRRDGWGPPHPLAISSRVGNYIAKSNDGALCLMATAGSLMLQQLIAPTSTAVRQQAMKPRHSRLQRAGAAGQL